MVKDGCSYGKVTRAIVGNIKEDLNKFEKNMTKRFDNLENTNTKLYNHLSSRLPPWATALGAIGIGLISVAAGILVGKFI